MNEPSENEARLEAELAAARLEITALRAAAEGRGSAVGAARRSDLLVLQELETDELRARLAEANGCAGKLCNHLLHNTDCESSVEMQFTHPVSVCSAV